MHWDWKSSRNNSTDDTGNNSEMYANKRSSGGSGSRSHDRDKSAAKFQIQSSFDIIETINDNGPGISNVHSSSSRGNDVNKNKITKVGIIVPYVGDSLPNWFDAFCVAASTSSNLYEWIILITNAPMRPTPPNIRLVRITLEDFSKRVASLDESISISTSISTTTSTEQAQADLDGGTEEEEEDVNIKHIQHLLNNYAYMIVELKPCFGFMFSDLLTEYSHWGYADIDQLPGRLQNLLSIDMLNSYDILTTSFGDNFRMYTRGQFTIHKNIPFLTNLWKSCNHLSKIGERLRIYKDSDYKKWQFHSAEGCYARVIADRNDLSLFVSASQLSDAAGGKTEEKESFLIGNSLFRCYHEPILNVGGSRGSHSIDRTSLKHVVDHILLDKHFLNGHPKEVLPLTREEYMCAYWLPPEFQVCLSKVSATRDILFVNGKISVDVDDVHVPISSCREGSTMHFQGWKKRYYHFFARAPPLNAHSLVITDTGFIPLKLAFTISGSMRGTESLQLPTFSQLRSGGDINDGRVHPNDIKLIKDKDKDITEPFTIPRLTDMPIAHATSINKSKEWWDPSPNEVLATTYCVGFSTDLKHCRCPISGKDIAIIQIQSSVYNNEEKKNTAILAKDVTMISVAWVKDYQEESFDAMLDAWNGPKLIILGNPDSNDIGKSIKSRSVRSDVTIVEVNLEPCYIKMKNSGNGNGEKHSFKKGPKILPDSTLLNIALDIVATDLVAIFPMGIVPQYPEDVKGSGNVGLKPVIEQYKLATDVHKYAKEEPGPVALVIPTFILDESSSTDDKEIRRRRKLENIIKEEHMISFPNENGKKNGCGRDQSAKLTVTDFTKHNYNLFKYGSSGSNVASNAHIFSNVDFDANEFLAAETMLVPFVFNQTAGPHGSSFVRFAEELAGPGCFGTTIFRILAGSGFHLRWSAIYALATKDAISVDSGGFFTPSCGCAHGDFSKEGSLTFINRLQKYYYRAIQLRVTGFLNLHSKEPFGKKQEQEQKELMEKSEAAKKADEEDEEKDEEEEIQFKRKKKRKRRGEKNQTNK
jgi:hypothetical protein